ncbi:MAG: hypothetical protein JW891_07390 [Candidatus Lokiarchaeota archaeon]|nr:hypothetical protein [Candidatus Lokiarchaeota archaeon]
MINNEREMLISYLKSYVSKRRLEKAFKIFLSNNKKKIEKYIETILRSFVNCLFDLEGEITTREIALMCISEIYYVWETELREYMEIPARFQRFLEIEVHPWLLYLQGNQQLPKGLYYTRFTCTLKKIA